MSQGYNIEQQVESIKNFFFHIFTKLCQEISLDFQREANLKVQTQVSAIILSGKLFHLKIYLLKTCLVSTLNLLTSSEMFFHSIHHKTQVTASLQMETNEPQTKNVCIKQLCFYSYFLFFSRMHNAKK